MNVCMAPVPVVFDLDGTLIDSAPDIHAAVNATLRAAGYAPLSFDMIKGFIGQGVAHTWTQIAHARAIPSDRIEDLLAGFMTRYHSATALTRIYPGVLEALGALADAGHPLGICTNKPMGPTRAVLDHFGIAGLFAVVIAADSLPERKPDPAPLRKAMADLGADPRKPQGIYVGDSEVDAQTAMALDVPFLLYTRGYRKAAVEALPHHAAFDDFAALPALIEQLRD
ncbi:phosphoglycolate phosphatase [Paracoccus pacificus]|uniref:Phosphoglycolate phosphatase n=1 Tax=Paracoccus pacificus TaxID=1463598 RepID=A0ABW4R4T3_9RHOB